MRKSQKIIKHAFLRLTLILFASSATNAEEFKVDSTEELRKLLDLLNKENKSEQVSIFLSDGIYESALNIPIRRSNIHIRSKSASAKQVILIGNGMKKSKYDESIFDVSASNITISDITMKNASNHLIQIRAEKNADHFTLRNCILQDAFQQLIKVSGVLNGEYSDYGVIENNIFEYTAGVGPNYYIGGIDAHRARFWKVSNNRFYNIASPKDRVAEHAIHFWNGSSDNEITHNLIVDSDRAIGFGMHEQRSPTYGGRIAYNHIIHTNSLHPFADAAITLENSPNTIVLDNTIYMTSDYPNAIEYRFPETKNVLIENNITNKAIKARNGARATLKNNTSQSVIRNFFTSFYYNLKIMKKRLFD